MFDFRYHVVSLAAVFLALVVGIVIGVGLSGQGVLQDSERQALNDRIAGLNAQLASANTRLEQQRAAESFVDAAYPAVMADRLAGKHVVVVFVGRPSKSLGAIEQAIAEAGGTVSRTRILKVPIDDAALAGKVDSNAELVALASPDDVHDIGSVLGRELLDGGDAPLWDALAGQLVIEQQNRETDMPADGIVVVRTADLQQGPTARFLSGLYAGLTGSVPAVWVDTGKGSDAPARHPAGFASVRGPRTELGRVALVVLLETGVRGDYGPGADTVVPPIEPVPAASPEGG